MDIEAIKQDHDVEGAELHAFCEAHGIDPDCLPVEWDWTHGYTIDGRDALNWLREAVAQGLTFRSKRPTVNGVSEDWI